MLFIYQTVFTNRKRGCALLLYKTRQAVKNEVLNFISSQPHFTVLKAIQFLVGNLIFIRCAELETARRLTLFVDKVLTVARSAGNFPVIAW